MAKELKEIEEIKEKSKGFISEFKTFIMRGSVIDMAVGIAVGGAFNDIVNSLVKDIINPIIGFIIGNMDFKDLKIILKHKTANTEEVAIRYGLLIQNVISFLITGFALFLVIKAINKLHEKLDGNK